MRQSTESPYFRTSNRREGPSSRMLVITLLTLILPPFGLVCLWRGARCPLRGKLVVSALGVLSMTLIFSLILSRNIPVGDKMPINYQYPSVGTTMAPAQGSMPNQAADGDESDANSLEDGIAPGNPLG